MVMTHMRRYWLAAHLYFGLLLGGFFVLLGLTGSILVFYLEIDATLSPVSMRHHSSVPAPHLDHVMETLHKKFPDKNSGWRIELPLDTDMPIMARYMHPIEKQAAHFAPLMVYIDANTHEILSTRFWGDFFVTWVYDLHYRLLLEGFGKTIVAVLGVFLMLSLFSGVYLWWPRQGNFRKALKIRPNAHWVRKIYDWHKISGLIGFVFLLMLAVTGVMLEKPDWFRGVLNQPEPLFEMPYLESEIGHQKLTLDQVKKIAELHFPQAQVRWIYTPEHEYDVFQVRMAQAHEPSQRFPKTIVWIDQYSGDVLLDRNALEDAAGDVVLQWLHPLHNGEALGLVGRWLIFFSGFIPLILFLTGFIRWRHKAKCKVR